MAPPDHCHLGMFLVRLLAYCTQPICIVYYHASLYMSINSLFMALLFALFLYSVFELILCYVISWVRVQLPGGLLSSYTVECWVVALSSMGW